MVATQYPPGSAVDSGDLEERANGAPVDLELVWSTDERSHRPARQTTWNRRTKRTMDVVLGSVALVAAAPAVLLAALLIKLDSPGPVLFKQVRIGRNRRPFTMIKLRTMVQDAEDQLDSVRHLNEADGPLFKVANDPRVTRIGRWLRALSIDELPQLWNVVRGDMSLVGPRPALPHEVDEWPPGFFRRLDVQPGITGLWQVSGRSELTFEDYVTYDLRYVDTWTPARDIAILARTIPAVITKRGAS